MVRARLELEEHTPIGDVMVRAVVRAQLGIALRLAAVTVLVLGAVPLLGVLVPGWADVTVAGIRLPWLVLGVGSFLFLYGIGRIYLHLADRVEREFTQLAED